MQAVLCRNGKGFCLTKEHTTRNTNERRRVLQNGAVITSNEPYGLLEGEIEITRGLGFHGNLRLKKFFIPVPQTISVPVDDLCQFLILATNGLWEVLDKKEVIALTITEFQMYKDTHDSTMQNKPQPAIKPLLFPVRAPSTTVSEGHIRVLFECKLETKECVSTTDSNGLSDFKHSEYPNHNHKNGEVFPPEKTNPEPDREKEAESCREGGHDSDRQSGAQSFYNSAAEHVSRKLVHAALSAGSRDNITVMVVFLNGISDDFLRKEAPMIQDSIACQTRIQ